VERCREVPCSGDVKEAEELVIYFNVGRHGTDLKRQRIRYFQDANYVVHKFLILQDYYVDNVIDGCTE
jgi:hypothetical protein